MNCPGCGSGDLDATALCKYCGLQLSVKKEQELRAQMPPVRTKAIEDDKFDYAIREGT